MTRRHDSRSRERRLEPRQLDEEVPLVRQEAVCLAAGKT
jgi:hypothetical protein